MPAVEIVHTIKGEIQLANRAEHPAVEEANALTVRSQPTADKAGDLIKVIRSLKKSVDDDLSEPIADAHRLHKSLTALRRKHIEPLDMAEARLRRSITAWAQEEERKRREIAARQEAEARRKEAERQAAEAARYEKAGLDAEDAQVMAEATAPPAIVAAPKKVEIAGLSMVDNWEAVVEDPKAVLRLIIEDRLPMDIIEWRQGALNGVARAFKGTVQFPGLKIVNNRKPRTK